MYYNWDLTLSKDARIYMIVGTKGIGKTYGLRKKLLQWQDKRGDKFLEVYRTKDERKAGMDEWAAKLLSGGDVPQGYNYISHARRLSRYKCDASGKKIKGVKDETVGYFVSMSELQNAKRGTYDKGTNNVLLDEAIIDKRLDGLHRYKPYEWELLSRIIDSVLREEQGDNRKTRLFLLANAVDLVNPYFQAAGINTVPSFGYHWYLNKKMLLHYVPSNEKYSSAKKDSLAAIMMNSNYSKKMGLDGEFIDGKNKFVLSEQPKNLHYLFGISFKGNKFGVWESSLGFIYIDNRMIENVRAFALTSEDGSPNMLMARRSTPHIRMIGELYYAGEIRYKTEAIRRNFLRALASFGVR